MPNSGENGKRLSSDESKLLGLLSKHSEPEVSFLAKSLDVSSEDVIILGDSLSKKGYKIAYDKPNETIRLLTEAEEFGTTHIDISEALDHFRIGVIAETRIGSIQQQMCLLRGVYENIFKQLGTTFNVVVGNLLVGKPDKGSARASVRQDVYLRTPNEQRNFVVEQFPTSGKGVKTYIISGRCDLTFNEKGYSIIQDICQRRDDFVYCGDQGHIFDIKGTEVMAMNPYQDNGPDGKSYGPEKIARSLYKHPDILLVAGMHRAGLAPDYWNDGKGDLVMIPSMHTQMARQRNKQAPVHPDIGVCVIDIDLKQKDKNGRPKVSYRFINLNPYADYSQTEHLEPYPSFNKKELSSDEKEILKWLNNASSFGLSIGEMSRKRRQLSRQRIEEAISRLKELGYPIDLPGDKKRVYLQQSRRTNFSSAQFPRPEKTSALLVSDSHLTSKHQQVGILHKAYKIASERGIRHAFNGGDVHDGPAFGGYKGHDKDVTTPDPWEQLDYARDRYPHLEVNGECSCGEGCGCGKTYMIDGNHDGWQQQFDFVKELCDKRDDLEFLGSQYGHRIVEGVYYYVIHPRGGSGDSLSRKLEKHINQIRNRTSKGKGYPRVAILGNWHISFAMFDRDILGFLVPCMKDEDEFHATLALVPKIGFWLSHIEVDENGNIFSFTPEYFGFSEDEIDPIDYLDFHKWLIMRAQSSVKEK